MKLKIVTLLFFLLTNVPLFAQPAGYTLIWADEFDGTELDTTKWHHRQLGPRRDGINTRDAVKLDGDGRLLLTATHVDSQYHVGMIGTQPTFQTTFGYFECRVRMQKSIGHWSAFWLQSPTVQQVGDPKVNGTEIDIFEYLRVMPDTLHHNLHWNGYGEAHESTGRKVRIPEIAAGFHTIALEWTPEEYIFFVDGKETWRTQTAVSHRSEYIILSTEVGPWAGDIRRAQLPDSLIVDYVRVYQKPVE